MNGSISPDGSEPSGSAELWRDELTELIARGVQAHGIDVVREALGGESESLPPEPEPPEPLRAVAPVLGLSACVPGWVGVLLVPGRRPAVQVAASLTAAVEHARGEVSLELVAIGRDPDDQRAAAVRAWLGSGPGVEVIEVRSVASRRAMSDAGLILPGWFRGSGFTEAELEAACAAAWTAARQLVGAGFPK